MSLDFNNAQSQQGDIQLVPDGTIAPVIIEVRGEKRTKAGDATMLDCEFTVSQGEYSRRKFWGNMMISSNGSEGHERAVAITQSTVRGILESAYGVEPKDDSPDAMAARRMNDWSDLSGLEFVAKIGIEEGKGDYKDKNTLVVAITPDKPEYQGFKPARAPKRATAMNGASQQPKADAGRPAWA